MSATATRLLDNYVAGAWTPATAASDDPLDVTNPATGEVLARVPLSGAADLDAAVAAARAALPEWRAVSTIERARRLFTLRERLVERHEDLARSVTTEMGKTIADARAEVARDDRDGRGRDRDPDDDAGPDPRGRLARHRRRDDPPAGRRLRGDRPVQLPGDGPVLVPAVRDRLRQHLHLEAVRAGPADPADRLRGPRRLDLPAGVVNLVNGGREIVEGILDHPGIDAVSFVGSAPVAKLVYERAAKAGKRVQALGGAKNHMVVMPDAVIGKTVDGLIGSAFGAAGQRCMAGSVVVTVGEAHDRLLPELVEATKKLQRRRRHATRRPRSARSSRARRATGSRSGSTAA